MITIINAHILTMAGKSYTEGYIRIEKNKIIEINDMSHYTEVKGKSKLIDATGKIVMPGLIDAHCHIGLSEEGVYREISIYICHIFSMVHFADSLGYHLHLVRDHTRPGSDLWYRAVSFFGSYPCFCVLESV